MADIYSPRPGAPESEVLKFLEQIDGEAESSKRDSNGVSLHARWEENVRQVRGDQWRLRRAPYFLANVIKNEVRRKVASLTESKPQIQVRARRAGLNNAATVLQNVARAIFERSRVEEVIYRVAQFGMTMGVAFMGVFWDKNEDDVEITFIDPRRVYLDPSVSSASDLNRASYIRIDTVLPLHEIRAAFPGRGALVEPDERHSSYSELPRSRMSVVSAALSLLPRPYRLGQSSKAGPIPRAEIREYWIRDPQVNLEGNLLFPGGRHIVRAGKIILLDEPNPYIDGQWPIEMFEWDIDYDSAWGMDEVQDLRRIQEAINRLGDAWVHNTLLGSNFKVIGDLDALDPDQWDKLDNEAGLIIRRRPGRTLEYHPPIDPNPNMPNHLESLISLMDLLTGNSDIQGGRSMAASSASFEGLQMARQTLVRSVARRLESMLERIGQKLISRIFQYYHGERVLFLHGPTREWVSYIYERQKLLEDDRGMPRPPEELAQAHRDFRFMVVPLSSLALTRVQRVLAALQLRSATGVAPSVKRILSEADMGDPEALVQEGLEELTKLPQPPPPKGRGGRK